MPQALSQAESTSKGKAACHACPSGRTAMLLSKQSSNLKGAQDAGKAPSTAATQFTVSHQNWPKKPYPPGMVWIPAAEFSMGGSGGPTRKDEFPVHKVRLNGFWMDETEVTNAQFKKFVQATGYVTTAEKKPEWAELKKQLPPGTPEPPSSKLVPGSLVFHQTKTPVPLNDYSQWWDWIPGASWKHPLGPESSIAHQDNYPVVQVSWYDAVAYCKWAGKRLPTEAEFELAARGGSPNKIYSWGDEAPSGKNAKINFWQGGFPYENKQLDGYALSAPVKSFAPNGYGLYEIIGNVWEWCSDWYRADYYNSLATAGSIANNPEGPSAGFDPTEPYMPKRVVRGGSFLCRTILRQLPPLSTHA